MFVSSIPKSSKTFFSDPQLFFYGFLFYASTVNVFTRCHKRAFTATTYDVWRLDLVCMPPTWNIPEVISGILSAGVLPNVQYVFHIICCICCTPYNTYSPIVQRSTPEPITAIHGACLAYREFQKKWSDTDTRRHLRSNNENDVSHVHCPSGASFLSHNIFRTAVRRFFIQIGWMKRANNALMQQTWLMTYDLRLDK